MIRSHCWMAVIDHGGGNMCSAHLFGTVPFFRERACVILSCGDEAIHLSSVCIYVQCTEEPGSSSTHRHQINLHSLSELNRVQFKNKAVHSVRFNLDLPFLQNLFRYRIMQYFIWKPWCATICSLKNYSLAVLLPCATPLWKLKNIQAKSRPF